MGQRRRPDVARGARRRRRGSGGRGRRGRAARGPWRGRRRRPARRRGAARRRTRCSRGPAARRPGRRCRRPGGRRARPRPGRPPPGVRTAAPGRRGSGRPGRAPVRRWRRRRSGRTGRSARRCWPPTAGRVAATPAASSASSLRAAGMEGGKQVGEVPQVVLDRRTEPHERREPALVRQSPHHDQVVAELARPAPVTSATPRYTSGARRRLSSTSRWQTASRASRERKSRKPEVDGLLQLVGAVTDEEHDGRVGLGDLRQVGRPSSFRVAVSDLTREAQARHDAPAGDHLGRHLHHPVRSRRSPPGNVLVLQPGEATGSRTVRASPVTTTLHAGMREGVDRIRPRRRRSSCDVAASSLVPAPVRNTIRPSTRRKLTGRMTGKAPEGDPDPADRRRGEEL